MDSSKPSTPYIWVHLLPRFVLISGGGSKIRVKRREWRNRWKKKHCLYIFECQFIFPHYYLITIQSVCEQWYQFTFVWSSLINIIKCYATIRNISIPVISIHGNEDIFLQFVLPSAETLVYCWCLRFRTHRVLSRILVFSVFPANFDIFDNFGTFDNFDILDIFDNRNVL